MSEIKSLNGYALVDTNAREGIDALTEQIGGLSEEMGAVVKSVNGVMPDENGQINLPDTTVKFTEQELTEAQQTQVLENIGAISNAELTEALTEKVSLPKSATGIDRGQAGQFAVSDGMGGIMWKTLFEVEEVAY